MSAKIRFISDPHFGHKNMAKEEDFLMSFVMMKTL